MEANVPKWKQQQVLKSQLNPKPVEVKKDVKISKKVEINISSIGEVNVTFSGDLWARIDLEKAYKAMLRELPRYYKLIKEKENVRTR